MSRYLLSFSFYLFAFFVGTNSVGVWYYSPLDSKTDELFSATLTSVMPGTFEFEDPCVWPRPVNRRAFPEEAVYLAECFLIQNGYTNLPPLKDRAKLTAEPLFGLTDDWGMAMRHDSLERRAHSYYQSREYGGKWVVVFRYRPHGILARNRDGHSDRFGRAVEMDLFGRDLTIQHEDHPLNAPEAVLIGRQVSEITE